MVNFFHGNKIYASTLLSTAPNPPYLGQQCLLGQVLPPPFSMGSRMSSISFALSHSAALELVGGESQYQIAKTQRFRKHLPLAARGGPHAGQKFRIASVHVELTKNQFFILSSSQTVFLRPPRLRFKLLNNFFLKVYILKKLGENQ